MIHRNSWAAIAITLCALAVNSGLTAQDDINVGGGDPPKPAAPDEKKAGSGLRITADSPSVLYMMVRTGPKLNRNIVERTLTVGLSQAGCQYTRPLQIDEVNPFVIDQFERALNRTGRTAREVVIDDGNAVIQTLPSADLIWEFQLKDASQNLNSIKITYDNGDEETFKPESKRVNANAALYSIGPGTYSLRLPPDRVPTAYEATYDRAGQTGDKPLAGKWPQRSRAFIIVVRDFKGDRDRLFQIIKDPNKVGNPFDDVQMKRDIQLVFASIDFTPSSVDEIDENYNYVITMPGLPGRKVRRVWVLAPLDAQNYKSYLKTFQGMSAQEVSQAIRRNAVQAGDPFSLEPGTQPKWIELTGTGLEGPFNRSIPLKNVSELSTKMTNLWRLAVWEFEDVDDSGRPKPETREAILVEPDNGAGGVAPVRAQEVKEWPGQIQRAAARSGTSAPAAGSGSKP